MAIKIYNPSPTTFGVQPLVRYVQGDIHERVVNVGPPDTISTGYDVSGKGKNCVQTTVSAQPLLIVGGLNGLDLWGGDGGGKILICDVPLPAAGTLFIVCNREPEWTNAYIFAGNGTGASPALLVNDPYLGVKAFQWFDGGFNERGTFSQNATGYHVLAITHDDAAGTPNTIGYFDGSQVFSITNDNWSGRSLVDLFGFGGYSGNIAEGPVIYPKVFTAWEVASLTRYYRNRRGI
jgi:hypothetical protein